VALVISLVLLIAMSLLAVSTLSGSRLGERAAANAQQKAIAFEVAESAIAAGFTLDQVNAALDEIGAGTGAIPLPSERTALGPALSVDFDQRRTGRDGTALDSANIEASVTIGYCGESPLTVGSSLNADESGMQMVALLFDVNGVATVNGSATRADHVQRGSRTAPRTHRAGGCTARGVAAP